MKKLSLCLVALIMVVMTAFSLVGCSYFVDLNKINGKDDTTVTTPGGDENPGDNPVDNGGNTGSNAGDNSGSGNGDTSGGSSSVTTSNNVVFNTLSEQERTLYTLQQTYEKVKRSSVAISVSNSAGKASGSGVILDIEYEEDGLNNASVLYVITCHHVIEDQNQVVVMLPDENCDYENQDFWFEGKIGGGKASDDELAVSLIGGDKNSDIALLRLDLNKTAKSGKKLSAEDISALTKAKIPATGYAISMAEHVMAIGNPTGEFPGTVTDGIISYVEREGVAIEDIGEMSLVQINVSTNPGSSGGGLYNLYGELIGITNAGNTSYTNINFAIPFVSVKAENESQNNGFVRIASELLKNYSGENYGFVTGRTSKLGITIQAQESGSSSYVYVAEVTSGSLAEKAGIRKYDKITSITLNGTVTNVFTLSDVNGAIGNLKIGDKVEFDVLHGQAVGSGIRYDNFATTCTMKIVQYRFQDTGK